MYTVKTNPNNEAQNQIVTNGYVLYFYTDMASVHFWPTDHVALNIHNNTVSIDYYTLEEESVGISALVMGY